MVSPIHYKKGESIFEITTFRVAFLIPAIKGLARPRHGCSRAALDASFFLARRKMLSIKVVVGGKKICNNFFLLPRMHGFSLL